MSARRKRRRCAVATAQQTLTDFDEMVVRVLRSGTGLQELLQPGEDQFEQTQELATAFLELHARFAAFREQMLAQSREGLLPGAHWLDEIALELDAERAGLYVRLQELLPLIPREEPEC